MIEMLLQNCLNLVYGYLNLKEKECKQKKLTVLIMDQHIDIHAISIRCLFSLFVKNQKSSDVKTLDETI